MIAFLEGQRGDDVELVQSALDAQQLVLPPVVLAELLSDPAIARGVRTLLAGLPMLEIHQGAIYETLGSVPPPCRHRMMTSRRFWRS
jgi:hypothetical protein